MTTQPFTNVGRKTARIFWIFMLIYNQKRIACYCVNSESFFNPGVALSLTCIMLTNTLIVVALAGALMQDANEMHYGNGRTQCFWPELGSGSQDSSASAAGSLNHSVCNLPLLLVRLYRSELLNHWTTPIRRKNNEIKGKYKQNQTTEHVFVIPKNLTFRVWGCVSGWFLLAGSGTSNTWLYRERISCCTAAVMSTQVNAGLLQKLQLCFNMWAVPPRLKPDMLSSTCIISTPKALTPLSSCRQ